MIQDQVTTFDTVLVERRKIADQTLQFVLKKPRDYAYSAGQSADIIIDRPRTNAAGGAYMQGFALTSAPYEPDIATATEIHADSDFNQTLAQLRSGSRLRIAAARGGFKLPRRKTAPVVFLTEGIGVAPARSLIAQAIHDGDERPLTLIAYNATPAHAPFIDELKAFRKQDDHFYFVQTYGENAPDGIDFERGPISALMIMRHVPDWLAPCYCVSGTRKTTERLGDVLVTMGVAKAHIQMCCIDAR